MAALSTCRSVLLFLILFIFLQALFVASTEFEVGGDDGWAIPKSKNVEDMYNQWASKNRFKVNDTINFKYEKDSLMEVNEDEYKKCKSSQPLFFANNGNTNFTLDRPGLFYFISGVSGHCQRGQKMIIKVIEPQSPPPATSQNSTAHSRSSKTIPMPVSGSSLIFAVVMTFFGSPLALIVQ
ncbi:mavicyanin [Punica granatum]|uniref:Mavicyanin n=1 Tax=Punica granatum TaxID=22663 RepID=A0A6P8BZH8_PUNGR|nr:mavicyanin [Punica granatum]